MLIVSLTTIPPRLKNLHMTIDSILKQTVLPDVIVLNLPTLYHNYTEEFTIPEDILNNERIVINRCIDYGPATKLLGLYDTSIYNNTQDDDIIIVVDDDRSYNDHLISQFVAYHKDYPEDVLTVAGWEITALTKNKIVYNPPASASPRGVEFKKSGYIDILGGCCGYLLTKARSPFHDEEIFKLNPKDTNYYVDDIWFSGFFTHHKIPIRQIPNFTERDETRNANNCISELASNNRINQNIECIQYFIDTYAIWKNAGVTSL